MNKKRLKYPLTPKAKEMAQLLVHSWANGDIGQYFVLIDMTAGSTTRHVQVRGGLGFNRPVELPEDTLPTLLELSEFGLIVVRTVQRHDPNGISSSSWTVLLLQELRNAVDNDFDVSDYFLTTQAIGTVVAAGGNLTINSPVLGAASIHGDVRQNYQQLAQSLRDVLGYDLLEKYHKLKEAIDDLEQARDQSRQLKLGAVIRELGRCLMHTANTSVVITAILQVSQYL